MTSAHDSNPAPMLGQLRCLAYRQFPELSGFLPRLISRGLRHPVIATDDFDFEGLRFTWTASIRTLAKAKRRGGVECRISRLAARRSGPGATCIDVGANYGFVSSVMAAAGGRVLSLEVDPFVHSVLEANSRRYRDWRVERCLVDQVTDPVRGSRCLDDVCAGMQPVRFIKIDTDGYDYSVLKGTRQLLRSNFPVICVECMRDQREIYELLQSTGYTDFYETDLTPLVAGTWPANLVASVEPLAPGRA